MCVIIQLASFLTPSDIMLGLLAAAAHDVDHPGVNQPFLIKTKHHLASLYQVKLLIELLMCKMQSRRVYAICSELLMPGSGNGRCGSSHPALWSLDNFSQAHHWVSLLTEELIQEKKWKCQIFEDI